MINNLHSIVHPLNRAADAEAAQEATPAK
jgi:hypothetical protein